MGILSRVFKSFGSDGYTPSLHEANAVGRSRIGSAIAKAVRQAKETTKLIRKARRVDWRLWVPNPDTLDDIIPVVQTGWKEGMPQYMTERGLALWILSIMKDIRVFAGITRRSPGSNGRKYLRSFWEGNIRRLFSDPECCWGEIFNEAYRFVRGVLPEINAEHLAKGRKLRTLTRSGVVRHLVATTYAGTNPRGNEFFFARVDGQWFSRVKPYFKIKSKIDAEKLIARGYVFGWDKEKGCECRIPIYCAFVRSLDTYYNADQRGEFTVIHDNRMESLEILNTATSLLTPDELMVVEAIARNPKASSNEIAKGLGWDGGIGKGGRIVLNTIDNIATKVNRPEWAEMRATIAA